MRGMIGAVAGCKNGPEIYLVRNVTHRPVYSQLYFFNLTQIGAVARIAG
jgi:hypothetical protein